MEELNNYSLMMSKRKKGKQSKARKTFKAETIKRLSLRSKCYCLSHSTASRIQKIFLSANHGGRQLFNVPWPLHFQTHSVGPE